MLRNAQDLEGFALAATDGVIGHVKDFYFDDEAWVIRYLVVDAGGWLSGRKVLISPIAIGELDWTERRFPVSITKEQVRSSPDIDTDNPVSRQHEMRYSSYYGYPYYWGGAGYWGGGMYPDLMLADFGGFGSPQAIRSEEQQAMARSEAARREQDDPHLRSCNAVRRYHIHASDGDIGHVKGMLVDDQTWAVRYFIVDTSDWWLGHQVLVAPQWIKDVNWFDKSVSLDLTRQAVKDAPAYDPAASLNRREEARLYEHYGKSDYWADHVVLETEISRL